MSCTLYHLKHCIHLKCGAKSEVWTTTLFSQVSMKVAEHLPGSPKVQDNKKPSPALLTPRVAHLTFIRTLYFVLLKLYTLLLTHTMFYTCLSTVICQPLNSNLDSLLYTTCFQFHLVYLGLFFLFHLFNDVSLTARLPQRPYLINLWRTVDGSTEGSDGSVMSCVRSQLFFSPISEGQDFRILFIGCRQFFRPILSNFQLFLFTTLDCQKMPRHGKFQLKALRITLLVQNYYLMSNCVTFCIQRFNTFVVYIQ